MSARVVFIHGSPRKNGNTLALARQAMAALDEAGVACDVIDVARLAFKYPGCIACYKCQGSQEYGCHVDDDLARAVKTLPDYDAVVLATPLYWFSYPAQAKMIVDRMFSLIKFGDNGECFSPLAGKPIGLLATGGGPLEENLDQLEKQWSIAAGHVNSPFLSCLFPACTYPPGKAAEVPALAEKARAFGRELAALLA